MLDKIMGGGNYENSEGMLWDWCETHRVESGVGS